MKNLILGTGWLYKKDQLQVFVESWKKYQSHNSKLILIVEPYIVQEKVNYLLDNGVDVRFFTAGYFIPSAIHNTRYYKYLDILLEARGLYDRVFLTDTRDVAFQGDIFEEIPSDKKDLFVFQEDDRFDLGERFNKHIITKNYGEEVAKELKDNKIICSGTTLGSQENIINYIAVLMSQRNLNITDPDVGFDQGLHNYIFHKDIIPHTKLKNGIGVGTLCLVPSEDVKILDDGKVQIYDKVPSVIHQWDRHHVNEPNLVNHYNELYLNCL